MPTFGVPQMPLTARVHRTSPLDQPVPVGGWTDTVAALRDTLTGSLVNAGFDGFGGMLLLVPKGTDIRGGTFGAPGDLVECPKGSGLYYQVFTVSDRWKGFPNEYRAAAMAALNYTLEGPGGPWWTYPQP